MGRLASPTEESSLFSGVWIKALDRRETKARWGTEKNRRVCVFLDIHPFPQKDAIYPMANQQGQPDAAHEP